MKILLVVILDSLIAVLGLWLSLIIRFEGYLPPPYLAAFPALVILLVISRLSANYLLRLHRWSFRFSGFPDAIRVGIASIFGSGLFLTMLFISRIGLGPGRGDWIPRSVIIIEMLLSASLMGLVRFSPRIAHLFVVERSLSRNENAIRCLILGAGGTGEQLLRDLMRSKAHMYRVIGFVDDDRGKHGTYIGGRPVFGSIADLPKLIKAHSIHMLLIAIPRLPARSIRELLSICANLHVRFKILPVSYVYLQEPSRTPLLSDLTPEDLLQRDEVDLGKTGTADMIRGRRVLVTGAAGSIGSEICRQLLVNEADTLIMLDINENSLYMQQRSFEREFPDARIVSVVADIRDEVRINRIFEEFKPQDVFHAAAHKHVPLMEAAPSVAVKNNVYGTQVTAHAARSSEAERFTFISTDKAVRPTSVMGATKRVSEGVVRSMARESGTKFSVVRFGNVLGSSGSVVPIFREQIAFRGPVTVTHPEVRRYFMTTREAVGLVLQAAYGDYGELCILDMGEQIRILDLARHMITMSGHVPDLDIPIVFTGLRPGEKLFEELLTEAEESTHKVSEKILIACSPGPTEAFEKLVDQLIAAATREDDERVIETLRSLIGSYHPSNGEETSPSQSSSSSGSDNT